MAYLEIHEEITDHPKTLRAARLLGVNRPQLVGHLFFLYRWAAQYAQDGDLSGFTADEIAVAAGWEGEPEAFVGALVECRIRAGGAGYLERTAEDGLVIHEWWDYQGRLIARRVVNRERMRNARASNKEASAQTRATHVRDTYAARAGANKPNQTESNQTVAVTAVDPSAAPVEPAAAAAPNGVVEHDGERPAAHDPERWDAPLQGLSGYKPSADYYQLAESTAGDWLDLRFEAVRIADYYRRNRGGKCGIGNVLSWLREERRKAEKEGRPRGAGVYVPNPGPPPFDRNDPKYDAPEAAAAARMAVRGRTTPPSAPPILNGAAGIHDPPRVDPERHRQEAAARLLATGKLTPDVLELVNQRTNGGVT